MSDDVLQKCYDIMERENTKITFKLGRGYFIVDFDTGEEASGPFKRVADAVTHILTPVAEVPVVTETPVVEVQAVEERVAEMA